uniref:TIR NB-ARC LRR protein n=2 Tax=Arachis duranensis TaxID=130453 RepID=N1NFV7_ARADU|nr:TIR NB-ARC LRR protein [Arachis duranensis]
MALVVGEASSSLTSPRSYTYHVFLSFRGEDTRTRFTSHLYAALNRNGITTYIDDNNLRKGDVISDELLKAIEESMFAVIVLSPNYASSSWCLDELCKILDCSKKLGQHIVTVFYDVEPSDVRHQKGTFEEALTKHEQRQDGEKVKRWRNALTQVAAYSGWHSKNRNEAALVESISKHIHEILIPKLPSSMKNLIGIDSRVEQVICQIGLGLNDVRYIGIRGMGGIGKTTIARAVFETIRSRFEVACFLADVRERCEKKDIPDIQKQLLDQMGISSTALYSEYDGRAILQNSLRLKKVLLVLDDVNHEKQLENLAGEQDWFGSGSRIIITTRDQHLLQEQGVHETYEVEGLVEIEAFNLFCSKAFKLPEPTEGFLDLSKEVVNYSGGLPLALKVLGSYLYCRSIEVWHSAIGKIKNSSHSDIIDVLKISYDGLDSMEKNIFLDISCFFKGRSRDYATKILKLCGHHAEIGIDILINRSLVTIEQDKYGEDTLRMHDLIEEMGKLIVNQESPDDASKRSRLWCEDDIDLVLRQNKETKATRSIVLYDKRDELYWNDLAFSNICQLKLLILDGVKSPILCNIPCTLRVLHWSGCPMETLPLTDGHYELVEIDLYLSKIVHVWHGKKFLEKLKYLNLSNSHNLKQTPDLSGASNLETLDLSCCSELNDIHQSLIHHKNLLELNLIKCGSLETLGDKLEMSSLKELDLYECNSLRKLPEFGECMKQLSILTLSCTGITELPTTIGNLVGLSELDLQGCKRLTCLPDTISGLKSLTALNVSDCPNLLLQSLDSLSTLTSLLLSWNKCVEVPISIHEFPRLRHLDLNDCRNLEFLPELPSSLRELQASRCKSLDASDVNDVISKACCAFAASASQDGDDVMQMLVAGEEIPSWFVHREEGNGITATFPHTETIALAICFRLRSKSRRIRGEPSVICNGEEFITETLLAMPVIGYSPHFFLLCLRSDCFVDQSCQDYLFQMLFPNDYYGDITVESSGARWVCKQDIQDLMKAGTETAT